MLISKAGNVLRTRDGLVQLYVARLMCQPCTTGLDSYGAATNPSWYEYYVLSFTGGARKPTQPLSRQLISTLNYGKPLVASAVSIVISASKR
jgi:hypothetical protein